MSKQKGMTLVEILVAFFLLSIITVMFGRVVMKELTLMQSSRQLTVNILNAAKQAETLMQYYRNYINSAPTAPLDADMTALLGKQPGGQLYTLFGKDVLYYPVDVEVKDSGGARVYCVETDQRP